MLVMESPVLTVEWTFYRDPSYQAWVCVSNLREIFPHAGDAIIIKAHDEPGDGRLELINGDPEDWLITLDGKPYTLLSFLDTVVFPLLVKHSTLYVEVINC